MPLSTADKLLYTTVKLTTFRGGQSVGSGTGFFWLIQEIDKVAVLVITNKHVIEAVDRVAFHCHVQKPDEPSEPSGRVITVEMVLDRQGIFEHPDADVDLVALGFSSIADQATAAGHKLFITPLTSAIVPTDEQWDKFDALEEVLMIGCPRGIYDETNNLAIGRRGITASSLAKRYNGRAEFLVDMACFPGSSGSPVFVYNRDGFLDRDTNTFMMGQSRLYLVGILYAGPLITNHGEIVLDQQPRVEVAAMMHLGQVIRSSALLELSEGIKVVLNSSN